jgi:hypothetical protein
VGVVGFLRVIASITEEANKESAWALIMLGRALALVTSTLGTGLSLDMIAVIGRSPKFLTRQVANVGGRPEGWTV